ncbi:MAG: energy-coupling factor ABC transporter permease [Firmicutes bacterium]|nr:energy-coupling factor ABC transporter permease [Bacillota bacterium]
MHMADALLSPAVAATMYVASGAAAGVSVHRLRKEDAAAHTLPTMAVASALVFAGQMVNYTIPGTGSSGHLCGGMLLSALLGPEAGFLSMLAVLTIQCLFFADGGLMALGANCWNMAFYGCFLGYYCLWRPIVRSRLFAGLGERGAARAKIVLASLLGCTLTLQLGAFSVVLETSLSGVTELPFGAFLALMQPIHLAIGLVEGAITSAVLLFVYEARPELLRELSAQKGISGKMSLKSTLIVLVVATLVIGGGISLLASANPDGLEWSLFGNEDYSENLGLDEEDYGLTSDVASAAEAVQNQTAILPDYSFADSDSALGTSVSGIVGSVLVAAAAALVYALGALLRRRKGAQAASK